MADKKRALAAAAAEARLAGRASGGAPLLPVTASPPSAAASSGSASAAHDAGDDHDDPPSSDLLPAFDKAIAAAIARSKNSGEDKHHVPALRKAKKAVLQSLQQGDDLKLSALHTLTGVGHWVVSQLREHHFSGSAAGCPEEGSAKKRRVEAPATPASFTWWYLDAAGKRVETRNDAQVGGGGEQYRVCILHSSGRMEKAWLPDAKAPPKCPE
eukprot:TRINITY_DN88970_c0_g1_i1.p1 TRINITY_DN88970_c0_g1~~TRINITY_DN88970_c0_g1_i1.p1  ORF type:complete len:213 (-),score=53.40 TRINITY_DN88970_c0_g1_i1:150-788(-)